MWLQSTSFMDSVFPGSAASTVLCRKGQWRTHILVHKLESERAEKSQNSLETFNPSSNDLTLPYLLIVFQLCHQQGTKYSNMWKGGLFSFKSPQSQSQRHVSNHMLHPAMFLFLVSTSSWQSHQITHLASECPADHLLPSWSTPFLKVLPLNIVLESKLSTHELLEEIPCSKRVGQGQEKAKYIVCCCFVCCLFCCRILRKSCTGLNGRYNVCLPNNLSLRVSISSVICSRRSWPSCWGCNGCLSSATVRHFRASWLIYFCNSLHPVSLAHFQYMNQRSVCCFLHPLSRFHLIFSHAVLVWQVPP